jgi:hypothetical protein
MRKNVKALYRRFIPQGWEDFFSPVSDAVITRIVVQAENQTEPVDKIIISTAEQTK